MVIKHDLCIDEPPAQGGGSTPVQGAPGSGSDAPPTRPEAPKDSGVTP